MRLIDADELIYKINDYIVSGYAESANDANYIAHLINGMPSAQQWIPCSNCERRCDKWENSKTSQG